MNGMKSRVRKDTIHTLNNNIVWPLRYISSVCYPISVSPSVTEQAPKRHRGNGDPSTEYLEREIGLHGRKANSGSKLPPGSKTSQLGAAASGQRQNDDKPELRNDDSSVFISNLAYTLEEPETKLRTLFETCGPINQVRPVFSSKGTFKGYCYVQFESTVSVPEALKLDRQEVEGRPMFVSPCVDKNKNPEFKVNTKYRRWTQLVSILLQLAASHLITVVSL